MQWLPPVLLAGVAARELVERDRAGDRGKPGERGIDYGAIDMKEGGTAIPYNEEDPFLRKEFEETLASVDAKSRMEPELYEKSY